MRSTHQRCLAFFMLPKEAQFNLWEERGRVNITFSDQKSLGERQFTASHQVNKPGEVWRNLIDLSRSQGP